MNSEIEKYKPNEYEIEYKITNKLKFFKNIQQYLHVERFERTKIYYFNSSTTQTQSTSKSNTNLGAIAPIGPSDLSQIRIIEDIETHKQVCEQKDVIIKNKIPLSIYPNEIQLKISKECKVDKIPDIKKADKVCYRYRLIFTNNELPFEIDLSMRVFPKNKNKRIPKFTDEDVFNPIYLPSNDYSIVYDLEFELLNDYTGTIKSAFDKLIKLLVKTNEEYSGKVQEFSISIAVANDEKYLKTLGSNSETSLNQQLSITTSTNQNLNSSSNQNSESTTSNQNSFLNSLISIFNFDFRQTPQVNVLTNKIIDSIDLSNFVYLEKTDGLRTLLIYDGQKLYTYRNKEGLNVIEINSDFFQNNVKFIVDSEFVDSQNKYYVFDVYYINNDIRHLPFIERMNKFKEILSFSDINSNSKIELKTYSDVDLNKLSELIKYGMTKRPGVDGIVFQSKDGYDITNWLKCDYQYKLKPLELTTTDFLYKWIDNEKCYYLYLIGSFGELVFNLKARPRCLQKAYSPFKIDLKKIEKRNDGYLILFDTPLFENMYKCEITAEDIKKIENLNQNTITNNSSSSSNNSSSNNSSSSIARAAAANNSLSSNNSSTLTTPQISSKIDPNKEGCLDGLIIETSYFASENRKYQQTPIRIRWDKVNPNGYRIGLANACILFSPPTAENHYFHKITNEDVAKTFKLGEPLNTNGESLINSFHLINQQIRDYTFEVLKKELFAVAISNSKGQQPYKTAFDLCGGRGSDLKRLYSLGFNNIIAADADAEALTTYSIKAIFYKAWKEIDTKNIGKLSLNCICEPLGNNGKELKLILEMKQRYEFKKCDLIVIDYALHYICNENYENNLKNMMKIIKSVSNPGVLILINFYDGDKIIENNGDFKIFKIKIDYKNSKAFMPLPTIEKDGYREEPLLLNKHIDLLKSEGMTILKDYYPMNEKDFTSNIEDIEMGKTISDYLNCIRSIIGKI